MAILEYFPGANTPEGFYSYYDYILKSREAKRIIVLKGGPGTGKSTFMKKIAKKLVSLGCETELLHCSSDPNSLDGVCAREIGFLILDGTSPHIVDPKCPGAADEIINLGECWDGAKIAENKTAIIETNENISAHFARSYRYLAAAKSLQKQTEYDLNVLTDMSGVRCELGKLKNEFGLGRIGVRAGSERKAFVSAITPLGRVNYIDTFAHGAKSVYKIGAKYCAASKMFMALLADMFKNGGYDIRTFYCSMSPDEKIEHIYVPALGAFFTTENAYHSAENADATCEINLDVYVDYKKLSLATITDMEQYNALMQRAADTVLAAKKLHDKLEQFYIPYMDFGRVESICTNVLASL